MIKFLETEIVDKLCVSASSGFVYRQKNNILFDPGRLKLMLFDEHDQTPSDGIWLIPFIAHPEIDPVNRVSNFLKERIIK